MSGPAGGERKKSGGVRLLGIAALCVAAALVGVILLVSFAGSPSDGYPNVRLSVAPAAREGPPAAP